MKSFELKDTKVSEAGRVIEGVYRLQQSTPGRGGTTLTLDVRVTHAFGKVKATIDDLMPIIESGGSTEDILDKLAEWMERGAEALRARGKPVPVFSNYTRED